MFPTSALFYDIPIPSLYKKWENLNFTLRRTAKMTAYTELEILRHTKKSYVALASVEGYDKLAVVKKISSDNIDLYKQPQTCSLIKL